MSCITEILKIKGDKELLHVGSSNTVAIEGGGIFKGYEYLITFLASGYRCGYVGINSHHPCYETGETTYSEPDGYDLRIHGGITFNGKLDIVDSFLDIPCDYRWLGFDAAHCYDAPDLDTSLKYFGECPRNKNLRELGRTLNFDGATHRDYQYMEEQCKYLIEQLEAIQAHEPKE